MEQLKTVTATEAMTNAIVKEEVTVRRLIAERKTMNNVVKEQIQLQKMSAMQWSEGGIAAKKTSQFMIPREATESVKSFGNGLIRGNVELGTWAHALGASSNNIIKWGKNTQWAGRQLMMGLTLPIIAFGATAGKLAYDLNVEFTKITKVYDFTANAAGQAAEQTQLYADSMNTARTMAKAYGADAKETMGILADLAATGEKGVELQRTAAIVTKAAFLGDLDRNDAIKATIALQNTFQMSNSQLSDSFAYMTKIANATSLSMDDFVVAIPRISGVLKSLGVDSTSAVKDMGVLMTAMRSASVGAAEGANTIKSVLFRAESPGKKAEDTFLAATNIQLKELVKSANGDPVAVLQKIGKALEGIADDQQRITVAKDVFGLFQGSKAIAMVQALADATGQVGVAMKINQQDTSEYYDSVDQATNKLQSSMSGRFKILLAQMKLSLAESGGAFLGAATGALGVIKSLIDAFNNLPSGVKSMAMWTGVLLAIGGAGLMLVGVLANLAGQILKTGAGAVRMATGFKVVTPAMKAQQLMAEQAALALDKEASQANVLRQAMVELAIGTTRASYAQEIFNKKLAEGRAQQALSKATATAAQNPVVPATIGSGWRDAQTGSLVKASSAGVVAEKARLVALTEAQAATRALGQVQQDQANAVLAVQGRINTAGAVNLKTTQETSMAMQKVRGAGLGTVGMMTMLIGGTHTWAIALGTVLTAMSAIDLVGKKDALTSALAYGKQEKAFASLIPSATKVGGAIKGWSAGAKGFASSIAASVGPLGWIMIAAAAVGASLLIWKNRSEEGAKEFAKLGDVASNSAEAMGLPFEKTGAAADKANDSMSKQISLHQKLSEQNKDAIKALSKMDDVSAKNYVKQIGLQFYLGTGDVEQSKRVMESLLIAAGKKDISKTVTIDFEATGNDVVDQLTANIDDISSQTYKRSSIERLGQGNGDLSQAAGSAGREQGKTFAMAMNEAISKGDMKGAADLATRGAKVFEDRIKKAQADFDSGKDGDSSKLDLAKEAYKNFLDGVKNQAGITSDSITTLQGVLDNMFGYTPPPSGLAVLPGLIKTLGLSADIAGGQLTTNFGDLGWAGDQFKALGKDIQDTGDDIADAQAAATAFTNASKSAMTTAWGDVLSHASDQMADRHQATMDAIDAASKKRDDEAKRAADAAKKAFDVKEKLWDKGWDAREKARDKYWDGRKKAIQAQIDAEQDAEKKRQAIFEAEKTRIERLSELYNKNIDFNVALNTGNLDEAAKVQNDMVGTEQGWAVDDASAGSASASDQRTAVLQKKLDAIDAQQQAEKDALAAQKQREKDALDAEKDALDASVQANQDAESKKTDAAKKAAEATYKARKDALDMELAALQNFIPKDAADLKAHIADVEATYARHGYHLDTKSKQWASYVNRAINSASAAAEQSLETDIKWATIGQKAGEDLSTGILGMSFKDFAQWMLTGKVPVQPSATGGANHFSEGTRPSTRYNHGGGQISSNSFSTNRLGRPLSAGLYHDEVPAVLQKGEFVVKKPAVDKIGVGKLHALNNGMGGMDKTGRMHSGGLVGGAGGKIVQTFKDGLGMAMTAGAIRKSKELAAAGKSDQIPAKFQAMFGGSVSPGEAGKYGGTTLNADQLANAAAILNVGRTMGATDRDLVVSLMTALQESDLVNLAGGDRDSVGLFQQRPSQGWGSVAEIMNPAYSARKFFEQLLKIKDRDKMALTAEAQAVQRSGFPMAYAKWESTARSIIAGMGGTTGAVSGGWGNPDAPGYAASNIVTASAGGLSWSQNKLAGNRFVGLVNALIGQGYRPRTVQGYNNRNIAGSDHKSNHAYGAAVDIDPTRNPRYASPQGGPYALPINSAQIAAAFGLNWGGTYKSSKDYMHFEVLGSPSAPKVPGMAIGGTIKYDNTIANLHKNETVLTAPLSKSLENGIKNMERGGDTYSFNFDGATFAKEIDVERAVTNVLNARDARLGRKRTVGR
jgi:hypothetical protein